MHNLHTQDYSRTTPQRKLEIPLFVSRNNPRETRFYSSATQVKPRRAWLGTEWVTHREYHREGPYFVFLYFLFFFFLPIVWRYF